MQTWYSELRYSYIMRRINALCCNILTKFIQPLCIILLCMVGLVCTYATASAKEMEVPGKRVFTLHFPKNSSKLSKQFDGNAAEMASLQSFFAMLRNDKSLMVDTITISSQVSPEGDLDDNSALLVNRRKSIIRLLQSEYGIPAGMIREVPSPCALEAMLKEVKRTNSIYNREIIKLATPYIGCSTDSMGSLIKKLREADYGHLWVFLAKEVFPALRRGEITITVTWAPMPLTDFTMPKYSGVFSAKSGCESVSELAPATLDTRLQPPHRVLTLGTNLVAWGAAISNVWADYRFHPALSGSVALQWSAWNYGKVTRKMRIASVRPALRWWPARRSDGFFAGVHFMSATYNFTLGDRRIQDGPGNYPALGGGLTAGWRSPALFNSNWKIELSAGVGAYRIGYEEFQNRPNGLKIGQKKRLYVGPDDVAVSVVYQIPFLNYKW